MKLTQTPENRIMAVLEEQSVLVNKLYGLLEQEQFALQNLDLEALEQTTFAKSQLSAALTTTRAAALKTIQSMGFDANESGYGECVDSFAKQNESVARYRHALAESSRKCMELNRQNGLLISSGINLANDIMGVLRVQNSKAATVYNAGGRSTSTRPATTQLGSA